MMVYLNKISFTPWNQGVYSKNTLGAKELAILVNCIYSFDHELKVDWTDVHKAFDSIYHSYLKSLLKQLNFIPKITEIVKL